MEGAARNPQFTVDLDQCLYSSSYEGTQVLIAGELGFDALAKELSRLAQNPVMLLYLYDGDFWGYDFYGGTEEDHFSTMPDYFDSISQTAVSYTHLDVYKRQLSSFMVFYNDEANLGAVKLYLNRSATADVFLYGEQGKDVYKRQGPDCQLRTPSRKTNHLDSP